MRLSGLEQDHITVFQALGHVDDTLIPTVLCVVGIFLSALVSVASCEPTNWIQWVILVAVSIGQGYVLAAAAVCLNQLIKQHGIAGRLKKGFDGQEKTEVSDSEEK